HLFQKTLVGDALAWFISLSASEMASFDIVAGRFTSHFSFLIPPTLTLTDLVNEKMKPDESFPDFANRWVTMANKSKIRIPESQAVTIMVNNTVAHIRAFLVLTELRTFAQVYHRAKII